VLQCVAACCSSDLDADESKRRDVGNEVRGKQRERAADGFKRKFLCVAVRCRVLQRVAAAT